MECDFIPISVFIVMVGGGILVGLLIAEAIHDFKNHKVE